MVYSDILLNYALLVCTWRHGGHVGGQEQQHLSPLGTKRHFHVNSSRKNSSVLTTDMAALSRGCKQNIFHYEVRSYATPQIFFFWDINMAAVTSHENDLWKRDLRYQCGVSYIKGYFQLFLLLGTWKARPKTSFSGFEYLGLHLKTLHSPSSKVPWRKVTASSPGRISVLPSPGEEGWGREGSYSFE